MNPEICGVGSEAGSLTDCGSSKGWQKSTGWRIPISGQSLLGWNDLGTYPVFDRPYSHGLIAQACHGFIGAVRELRREVSARASCVCHSRCLPNTLANASRARMWLQISQSLQIARVVVVHTEPDVCLEQQAVSASIASHCANERLTAGSYKRM